MQPTNRIIVNTLAQYARTIINMVLSLYSSRLVLNILGVDDYGIYSLVAGVVSLLSFFTNSLVGSTQRFLSVSQGKGDIERLKVVFSNSLILHLGLGLLTTIILESIEPLLFNGFLNIPFGREVIASALYQQVILMVYISFIASPYRALLISRENIVYISIVDVLDGILKVALVLLLPFIQADKLLVYGWIMFGIQVFNLLAFSCYCHRQYDECIWPKFKNFSFSYVKELFAYTGWVVYSTAVIVCRSQGMAIVINKFYNAAANAAYGIGNQISGMLAFISTSFTNAVSPQLMAAEGGGNHEKMCKLAGFQSKFSFLLLSMLAIPTMLEMDFILSIWLGNVPENAALFGRMFIAMQTIDQLSQGLGSANRAIGNIGKYTIVTYTPKLFIIPLSYIILKVSSSLHLIVFLMVTIECICMLLRIYLFKNTDGFSIKTYCNNVLMKSMLPVLVELAACYIIYILIDFNWRCIITYIVAVFSLVFASYFIALDSKEKYLIKKIIIKVLKI